ncbi:serine/threonine protein phosphatase [Pseudoxanthomonas broegbernensis]|uniref:Serine/threonine protein phosphatase n=1 Tax=Pseudoxanthomonas broegbernensis TaxID=83619 RepID=A0A7V8GP21_9GAMM|nr:serine/threonine protein phosphatase [Pseudoxanthomonas broegbernensis]KAF1687516.1 serine/threonine protein phosphatase [Pseudoxanthomonas broegbernensis]MBB6064522.1 tRNA A-37 threonylcarbamoyl transferase component Bud32 [Pseudoxanthomonas broegbernensis]
MAVQSMRLAGRRAWIKRYGQGRRRLSLGSLDLVARKLDLPALRPPPHHGGPLAKETERRRIAELDALGVRVPEVLGENGDTLLLGDIGATLSTRLRAVRGDPQAMDGLVAKTIAAIADAHRRGAYLGQPLPRNITLDAGGAIGFIDFEEDPLEVMPLEQAQARDWLLFAFGMAKYYHDRPEALARMLGEVMRAGPPQVGRHARHVGMRLHGIARLARKLGRSARTFAHAVFVIHGATAWLALALMLLLIDWIGDGELDLLQAIVG